MNQSEDTKLDYSAVAKYKISRDFLPVSVWYAGGKARAPMLSLITDKSKEEWHNDLKQIKELGFNAVRTWVEWSRCEPEPGVYYFENLELLADLAQKAGLKFLIQLYIDSAPDWVGHKFPDALFETQSGARIESQIAPGYCTDHPGVRRAVENFIKETARIATRYQNFHGWDLWSEPHIVNWAYINYVPNVQFCFCPYTTSRFRSWLKNKYINLENLNRAWYRNYKSWEEVEPPRFGTILSYTDFIDWKNFIYTKLAEDLEIRYHAVRSVDTTHVITSHAAVPSIFYSPYNGYGATDDFLMADRVDYYGTSLYPKHNHPDRHWEIWKFMGAVDFSRSANRKNGGFYVGELQAGKGTYGLNIGNPVTPSDHRIWIWSAIAKGAKAINIYAYYPMSSGYESGGYGLVSLSGEKTQRAVATGRIARIINKNKDLFLKSSPVKSEIAIVYNPLSQMVGGEQRHGRGDMHQLSLFGYYRIFAENNIPVDFIHRRNLEKRDYKQYKLIILPYPLMLTQDAANGIKEFVATGGYLVSEARLAWNDERGFAALKIPGMGLSEVFGVEENKVVMRDKVHVRISNVDHSLTENLEIRSEISGSYFAESFKIMNNATPEILGLLEDNTPGITVNRYGEGYALLIGTFFGMAHHLNYSMNNEKMMLNALAWAGIKRPFTSSTDGKKMPVEIRLLDNENGFVLFIINHDSSSHDVRVQSRVNSEGLYEIKDLIHETSERIHSVNSQLTVKRLLEPRDVVVFSLKDHQLSK